MELCKSVVLFLFCVILCGFWIPPTRASTSTDTTTTPTTTSTGSTTTTTSTTTPTTTTTSTTPISTTTTTTNTTTTITTTTITPTTTTTTPTTTTTTTTTTTKPKNRKKVVVINGRGFVKKIIFQTGCIRSCHGHAYGYYPSCYGCGKVAMCQPYLKKIASCYYGNKWDDHSKCCQQYTSTCHEVLFYAPRQNNYHRYWWK